MYRYTFVFVSKGELVRNRAIGIGIETVTFFTVELSVHLIMFHNKSDIKDKNNGKSRKRGNSSSQFHYF